MAFFFLPTLVMYLGLIWLGIHLLRHEEGRHQMLQSIISKPKEFIYFLLLVLGMKALDVYVIWTHLPHRPS